MIRFLLVIACVLVPTLASAQAPLLWSADAQLLFNRSTINLRGDQASLTSNSNIGEFGLTLTLPQTLRMRYEVTTGFSANAVVTPSVLVVGSTDFSADSKTSTSVKPVSIGWTTGPTHTLELACLRLPNLFPIVMAKRYDFTVKARQLGQQGKQDSESIRDWTYAIGAEVFVPVSQSAHAAVKVAGSDTYLIMDALYMERVARLGVFGFGYRYETLRVMQDYMRVSSWRVSYGLQF